MSTLGVVEDTLFVPMLGRIYASQCCSQIVYDKKALELQGHLPRSLAENGRQSQYTLLASAVRSANMDRLIQDFLMQKPNGVIVQLGCGLETTYYRCDNGQTRWYAVDLPHVMDYRRRLLPEPDRETYLAADAFTEDWLRHVRTDWPDAPILVTAAGLFHYFEDDKVMSFFRMLRPFRDIEVIFDTVNKTGMTMMRKRYMKQLGHADAKMFFYVDSAVDLAKKIIDGNADIANMEVKEYPYYRHVSKKGLKLSTRISMAVSDWFCMVKMIHMTL